MTTADNAADIEQTPEGQAPPSQEGAAPETEADAREREVQRRLTQQGREAAEARRAAAAAQSQLAAQTTRLSELEAGIRLLTAHATERDQRDAEARQQAIKAELASLPPADRLQRQIELLQGQIDSMQRTAAPPAQPAQQPTRPQAQPQRQASDDERRAYMEQRVTEIMQEAERTYGVRPNLDQIPDDAWGTEDAFYTAAMQQARGSAGGNGVAQKPKEETPAQMRERIRQEERERLGATSPAAPRAATTGGRKKAASEADVRAAAQGYDSKLGPKANIQRMKALRESMG